MASTTSGRTDLPPHPAVIRAHRETFIISPARPFDLSQTTSYLQLFPPTKGDQVVVGHTLIKPWQFGAHTVSSHISQQSEGRLDVELTATSAISPELKARAIDRISFYLSVHDEIADFYDVARSDPKISRLIDRGYGYHQVKMASPEEHICWLILAHGKPLAVARRMRRAIEEHFGNTATVGSQRLSAFPSIEQLGCLDETDFRALTGNRRKAGYLSACVRRLARVDDDFLRAAPVSEVSAWLKDMPGISDVAASFFLDRGLGRVDTARPYPEALRDVSRVYSRPVDAEDFAKLVGRYGEWSRYWLLYMRAFASEPEGPRYSVSS